MKPTRYIPLLVIVAVLVIALPWAFYHPSSHQTVSTPKAPVGSSTAFPILNGTPDLNSTNAGYETQTTIPANPVFVNGTLVEENYTSCITNSTYTNSLGAILILSISNQTCQTGDLAWEFAYNVSNSLVPETVIFTITYNGTSVNGTMLFETLISPLGNSPVWLLVDFGTTYVPSVPPTVTAR